VYGGVLLAQGDYRYMFKDQYFFEVPPSNMQTMIYFLSQVLKHNFDRDEFVPLEEELNRIFRTNTFNLIKRRRQEDEYIKKYPVMKEIKHDTMPNIINKIKERIKVPPQARYEPKL
jgi:protein phosphatase 1 regulatory subunit 36